MSDPQYPHYDPDPGPPPLPLKPRKRGRDPNANTWDALAYGILAAVGLVVAAIVAQHFFG